MVLAPNIKQLVVSTGNIVSGGVFSFLYTRYRHDPYPVIIATRVLPNRVYGVNLHYLSFPMFRGLLRNYGDNPMFSYELIKNHPIIRNAFRCYSLSYIKNSKRINWKTIVKAMTMIRKYTPKEMEGIQKIVDQHILSQKAELIQELIGNLIRG